MVIDWHVHAGEAEFFERYPKYVDTFKKFWEPFIRLYHIDMFKMMNQSLDAKLKCTSPSHASAGELSTSHSAAARPVIFRNAGMRHALR